MCRMLSTSSSPFSSFFFNDTATTEIYTLSLHDALPILIRAGYDLLGLITYFTAGEVEVRAWTDRKSTRLNSSHTVISYAVFCLKKKSKAGARKADHPAVSPREGIFILPGIERTFLPPGP